MRLNLQIVMGRSLATLLLLSATFQIALAGNQYCYPRGNTNEFQLSKKLEFIEDRIIPKADADPVPEEGLNCKWKILTDHLDNSVVVLTGFDTEARVNEWRRTKSVDSAAQQQPMRYELHSKASDATCSSPSTSEPKPVELEMLRVLQLTKGSFLTVSFRLNRRSSVNIPGLHIRLMEPGFCGRSMTNFESNCYTKGSVRRNLTAELAAAMRADSGVMRLASFNSSTTLKNFVTESQRTRVGSGLSTRSKEPLNLAQRLRIGLFYEHRTKKVFYLNCGAEDCKIAEFEDADKLNHTVQSTNSSVSCGSLRAVNLTIDGEVLGLVSFTDCSEQLSALISFPDAAGNRCGNSSQPVLSWMLAAAHPAAEEEQTSPNPKRMRLILVLLVVSGAILLAVLSTLTLMRRLHSLQYIAAISPNPGASPFKRGGGPEVVCQSDSEKPLVRNGGCQWLLNSFY
ncbi:hypothetical protein BOX15_Mlig013553g3 [Macrostomum lignano]|uniref:CUB domain-containing protein n=1 Tax=Macrostomum lignano TaxID=282301 RepID=A0A267FW36_9PLAT|nr:hypothetical protein BOX15_Mlig013553g3 [Macrostomum lignano]